MATQDNESSTPRLPAFDAIDVGYQNLPGAANVFLLRSNEGAILIESGPQACLRTLEHGLRDRGVDPKEIAHLFVTHIHLDHAGAAGAFAAHGARIHVHPFGARHLIDPSKLIASSRRVHGDAYERFYGDPVPAPAERVIAVPDGSAIEIGALVFEAIETPGHARHHHAWKVRSRQVDAPSLLFTGDAAATIVPGSRFIGIPTPPPEYDLEAWLGSIERIRAAGATQLVLTHGGAVEETDSFLLSMRSRLLQEDAWLREAIGTGEADGAILPRYRAWLHGLAEDAAVPARSRDVFIGDAWMIMNLAGVRRALSAPI